MPKRRVIPKPRSPRKTASKKSKGLSLSPQTWMFIFGFLFLFITWYISFSSNTAFRSSAYYIYIPRGMEIENLGDTLTNRNVIKSSTTFRWMAAAMNIETLRPGMYRIEKGWGNYRILSFVEDAEIRMSQLIDLAEYRSRKRTINELCKLSNVDEKEFLELLKDEDEVDDLGGFTTESVYCIFRPGRYRVYKNMKPKELLEYMACKYVQLWNDARRAECDRLDLTEDEVVILASIVYSETKQRKEMPTIAGVYINRLHDNMKLQSDPTVLFASTSMNSRRVTNKQLDVESDYNTYKKKGLPPGPICIVPTFVIDEVLKYDEHTFFYFCAKGDKSGCHNFASTYAQHMVNAKKYRSGLDSKKIYK